MDRFDVQEALESFYIVADTREHMTALAAERYKDFGVPVKRATLDYGDYCGGVYLPDGSATTSKTGRIRAKCVIERKMSLDELAACFTRGRDRFRREFERASANDARVFLLVENASWEAIVNHRYRSKYNPTAYMASLTAWAIRYGMTPVFCRAGTSARVIKELLYRDIKERLEKGEYG